MEIKNVIYVAHVGELQDGKLANAYNEVCYTKKEAIHYCTEIIKKRLREIKEISLITAAELLRFMNDEEYHFNLTVTEYSTNRKEYEEPNGYANDFVKYLKLGGPDLYEKLLETIVSNSYEIDYFGNVMEIYTNPEAYVGYTEGKMSEEDCKDGVYKGSFSYYGTTEQDIPFKMRKAYVMADVEVYREPLEDDLGFYAQDLSCYESLEECEEYAPYWLFSDLEFYLPLDEDGYCQDITEEQKLDLFHEKDAAVVMVNYESDLGTLQRCGVAKLAENLRVLSMEEKPQQPKSNWCVGPFYIYKKEDLHRIEKGIREGCGVDAPGSLVSYLCEQIPVYALDIKDGIRYDIGTLESYEEVKRSFAAKNE